MSTVLWIVGEPGIGKTTLARALIQNITGHTIRPGSGCIEVATPKWTLFPTVPAGGIAAAGHWRGDKFDGSDTLPISQIKPAIDFWVKALRGYRLTIIDGDKLSNRAANDVVRESGAQCRCVLLENPFTAARQRLERGTLQNPSWVKGRRTKAHRFFDHEFDGGEKLSYNVAQTPLTEIIQDTLQLIHE